MKYYKPKLGTLGIIFLAVIFIEIAGFIIVGSEIGVFATLALILLGMIAGIVLLRVQGFQILQKMQAEMAQGRVPDQEMFHGALMVIGAILLIIPGFVTDIIGIILFIPPFRNFIWQIISKKFNIKTSFHENKNSSDKVIDLDASDYHSEKNENSPWKKNDDDRLQ